VTKGEHYDPDAAAGDDCPFETYEADIEEVEFDDYLTRAFKSTVRSRNEACLCFKHSDSAKSG
jgi:hypothetical protein